MFTNRLSQSIWNIRVQPEISVQLGIITLPDRSLMLVRQSHAVRDSVHTKFNLMSLHLLDFICIEKIFEGLQLKHYLVGSLLDFRRGCPYDSPSARRRSEKSSHSSKVYILTRYTNLQWTKPLTQWSPFCLILLEVCNLTSILSGPFLIVLDGTAHMTVPLPVGVAKIVSYI